MTLWVEPAEWGPPTGEISESGRTEIRRALLIWSDSHPFPDDTVFLAVDGSELSPRSLANEIRGETVLGDAFVTSLLIGLSGGPPDAVERMFSVLTARQVPQ